MKKPFRKYFNSRLALLLLAPIATISLGVNFTVLKTHSANLVSSSVSNSHLSLFIFSNIKSESPENSRSAKKLEPIDSKKLTAKYNEDGKFCGSAGCIYQVKDRQGKILVEGLSMGNPVWVESYTDGEKDLLHYAKIYPAIGRNRVIIECYNKKTHTYDSENCSVPIFDTEFVFINELPQLAKALLGKESTE
ncbi:hypothetical protein [Vampirovibrio sp.]|uniref:hypothetical protein n=1 Tax=Vampirovibrio sp. TaxID=2717857 RepID=UPI003593F908